MKFYLPFLAGLTLADDAGTPSVPMPSMRTINGNLYTQTGLYLRAYVPQVMSEWLDDSNKVDDILSHGCFCAKLDNTNPNFANLGGTTPLDELDEICRDWLRARNCNDNLVGGSCTSDKESMRTGAYTMDVVPNNLQISNCGFTTTDCEADSCAIDLQYMKEIAQFVSDNNSFSPNQVTGAGTCDTAPLDKRERKCEGFAPDVYPKRMSNLEQLLTRMHWDEDRDVADSYVFNHGGLKLDDNKEYIELCVRDQLLTFDWPNVKSFTVETFDTFNAYYVGWIEKAKVNNFAPGSEDTLGDDTKGGVQTTGIYSGDATIRVLNGLQMPASPARDFYDEGDFVHVSRDGSLMYFYVNGSLVNHIDYSNWEGAYPAIDLRERLCVRITNVVFEE